MGDLDQRIARFNRTCRVLAAVWLFVGVPISLVLRPTYQDFSLYYVAGVAAAQGRWDALYPVLPPDAPDLKFDASTLNPRQVELAEQRGVPELLPYIQPPWNALLFAPLSLLPFRAAHWVWMAVLIACVFFVSLLAGRTFEIAAGRASRFSGLATLVVACSLLSYRAIRVGNVSAVLAAMIGLAAIDLMRRDGARAGVALWLGGVLKFATGVLIPLVLVARRWRTLAWLVGLGLITAAGTYALTGPEPFREFARVGRDIAKSTAWPGNQSMHAFLLRATGRTPLPGGVMIAMRAVQFTMLGLILLLIARRPRADWLAGPTMSAAAVALVAWLVIFGPLFWEHYPIYLAPFWGWLIWEATQSRTRAVLVIVAIALSWVPLPAFQRFHPPEPIASYMLWSTCIMLGLAVDRLARRCCELRVANSEA